MQRTKTYIAFSDPTSVKVAELCELIVNLVTCHQHGEPYEPPYQVTMACKAIATIVALL